MKLFVAIFLATLSLVAAQSSSDDWKCGNGPVTSRTSFLLAGHFAKSDEVNSCCDTHNQNLDGGEMSREDADQTYCDCLSNIDSYYAQHVVEPIFCAVVKAYTFFIDNTTMPFTTTPASSE